jgi:glucans biosynthesis protein
MTPVITVSRGTVELTSARPLRSIQGFRAMFDLRLPDERPAPPVELRMYLAYGGQPMSETWCYQWAPPAAAR